MQRENKAILAGVIIVGSASFAATGAFLYSALAGGVTGAVAALVGVGAQLFAYALPVKGSALWVAKKQLTAIICMCSALAVVILSVMGTIGTLESAFYSNESQRLAAEERNQLSRSTYSQFDTQINTLNGLAERNVAGTHHTKGAERVVASSEILKTKVDAVSALEIQAINIDRLTGALSIISSLGVNEETLKKSLIIGMALAFDLLPILGLILLSRDSVKSPTVTQAPPAPEKRVVRPRQTELNVEDTPRWVHETLAAIRSGDIKQTNDEIKKFARVGHSKAKECMDWIKTQPAA